MLNKLRRLNCVDVGHGAKLIDLIVVKMGRGLSLIKRCSAF
jgi:hypothetical protein